MEDKRQYVRVSKSLVVAYQPTKKILRAAGKSKDLSKGGIRLSVFQNLEDGLELQLWIHYVDFGEPMKASGEVVWSKKREDPELPFEVGIKFLDIDPRDFFVLSDYIDKLVKEQENPDISLL